MGVYKIWPRIRKSEVSKRGWREGAGGCPLFSEKVRILSRTFSGLFLVGAVNRPREKKRTNQEILRKNLEDPENRESPKKNNLLEMHGEIAD